ncbi:hypothetical protein DICA4_E24300 [Diutina catenulata]
MIYDYGPFGSIKNAFLKTISDYEWYKRYHSEFSLINFDSEGHQIVDRFGSSFLQMVRWERSHIYLINKYINSENARWRHFAKQLVVKYVERWGDLVSREPHLFHVDKTAVEYAKEIRKQTAQIPITRRIDAILLQIRIVRSEVDQMETRIRALQRDA